MFESSQSLQFPPIRWQKVWSFLPYLGIVAGCITCIVAISSLLNHSAAASSPQVSAADICVSQAHQGQLTIYVSGAVNTPGLYTTHSGARVADALSLAGGVTKDVDRVYLQQELNLAAELQDAAHIYIPLHAHTPSVASPVISTTTASQKVTAKNRISINTASPEELQSLPRVGEKTAEKILAGRPYTDLFQLVGTKVLSQSAYDEIKNQLSL